jgi:uncharacterized protein
MDKPKHARGKWLLGIAAFLGIAGFSSVLLMPRDAPEELPAPDIKQAPVAGATPVPAVAVPETPSAPVAKNAAPAPLLPLPELLPDTGVPKVAILVADLGRVPAQTRAAISTLPPQVGMGFSPYGTDLEKPVSAARASGHEIWAGIPMQPNRYPAIDPGRNALLLNNAPEKNIQNFNWALAQIPGRKIGIYNHMGSAFTAKESALLPVLQSARAQGLLFADARSGLETVGPAMAAKAQTRVALSIGFIDDDPAQISARLDDLVARAKKDGRALGLMEARSGSIAAVSTWVATLKDKQVELAPVSQVTR